MFASSGTVLKIQAIDQNQIETLSTFGLPKLTRQLKIAQISWCYDNSYIAMVQEGSHPHIVNVKDKQNISLVHTIQALRNVTALTFKNNTKRYIALGTQYGEVHVYDTKSRSLQKKIDKFDSAIRILEFSLRDDMLAIATENALFVYIEQIGSNGEFVREMMLPACSAVRFHPSLNEILAFGTSDGHVTIKDMAKDEETVVGQRHTDKVTGIAFTPDKKVMVTAGSDKKICIFDFISKECLFRMNIHNGATSLDISWDNQMMAIGLEDGTVYVYNIRDPLKPLICPNSHNGPVHKVAFERGPVDVEQVRHNTLDKNSGTTLNDSEISECQVEQIFSRGDGEKYQDALEARMEEKLRKEMLRMVKSHMVYLERKLMEHCAKFQEFMDSEFSSLHTAMARWDIFNLGDLPQIAQVIDSADVKSSVRK
ncbi:unnamed protein product [Callosobruchus maculatus]|uniref:Anaphase-promoting complex subunit 4-like WD40 domain-containing protein n=1 Tax=Callosobruchus maculatus TaxID=64391 RepID=A0A653CHK0_CALMS|nr:unnamed protein product [Callosobruchus maculatus]